MIDIDRFVVSLLNSDAVPEGHKEAFRAALREQFLECNGKFVRTLRQEYKFRVGDKVRNRATGKEAHVVYADVRGCTIIDSEDMEDPERIYVSEWDLVPIEAKFKVGDRIVHRDDADTSVGYTVLGIEAKERRYRIGEHQFIGFADQDCFVLKDGGRCV